MKKAMKRLAMEEKTGHQSFRQCITCTFRYKHACIFRSKDTLHSDLQTLVAGFREKSNDL